MCDLLQEKVLEIEYIKAVAPQKEEEPSLHDDWVSAVDGSNPGYVCEMFVLLQHVCWIVLYVTISLDDQYLNEIEFVKSGWCNLVERGESVMYLMWFALF